MGARIVGFTTLGVAVGALASLLYFQTRAGAQHVRSQRAPNISLAAGEVILDSLDGSCVITSKTAVIYARPGLSIRWYVVNYCNAPQTLTIYFRTMSPFDTVPAAVTVPAGSGNVPGKRELTSRVRDFADHRTYQYGFTFNGTDLPTSDPDIIIDEWR